MLDELNFPLAAVRWKELSDVPEVADFTPQQLFRKVLETQYLETMNNRYRTNLRLSRLINRSALTENLVTSSKRRYNNAVVQQMLSLRFAEERLNVGVYGVTGRVNPISCPRSTTRPAAGITAACMSTTAIGWTNCSC